MPVTISKAAHSRQRVVSKKKQLIAIKKEQLRKRKAAVKQAAASSATATSARARFVYTGSRPLSKTKTAAANKTAPATPAAIYKAGIHASEAAMQTMGYTIVAEGGWLLQKNADGSTKQLKKI